MGIDHMVRVGVGVKVRSKVVAHPSLSVEYTTGRRFSLSMPSSLWAVSKFLSKVSTLPMLNQTYCCRWKHRGRSQWRRCRYLRP